MEAGVTSVPAPFLVSVCPLPAMLPDCVSVMPVGMVMVAPPVPTMMRWLLVDVVLTANVAPFLMVMVLSTVPSAPTSVPELLARVFTVSVPSLMTVLPIRLVLRSCVLPVPFLVKVGSPSIWLPVTV